MKIAIGVFAKTPDLSPVKTRLAETFGTKGTKAFYQLSVAAVNQNLRDLTVCFNPGPDSCDIPANGRGAVARGNRSKVDLSLYWALAEAEGPTNPFWADKPCFWTGEGGLGERLHQVTEHLFENHDYVFVMGTDSPQVGTGVLETALRSALENREKAVIGPCKDGGFYLFGMPRPLGKALWTGIAYSQEDTCAQLVERLVEKGFELDYLPTFGDVDRESDLCQLKKELLENQDALNREQRNLLNWLAAIGLPSSEAQNPASRRCE